MRKCYVAAIAKLFEQIKCLFPFTHLENVCDTDNVLIYFERSISQIDLVASLPCLAKPHSWNRERPYYSPTPGLPISINSINSCLDACPPARLSLCSIAFFLVLGCIAFDFTLLGRLLDFVLSLL